MEAILTKEIGKKERATQLNKNRYCNEYQQIHVQYLWVFKEILIQPYRLSSDKFQGNKWKF